MKLSKSGIPAVALVTGLGLSPSLEGAAVVVDWLRLDTAGSPSAFSLVDDAGSSVATGALIIEAGKGVSFPGLPVNNLLAGGFWSAVTGFEDSTFNDGRVGAVDFRVAPQGGSVGYVIELVVPAGRELVLAVGGLFRNNVGATQSLTVSAFTDSGGAAISLLQTLGWDSGTSAYNQELDWDALSGVLSTTVGSNGDSEIAFLKIGPLSGANPMVRLAVSNGYGGGTGDSITIGIGQVVPEPGVLGLAGLGCVFLLAARRR